MKYFKEEKEILEKLRDDLKEYVELKKKFLGFEKKRPKAEKLYNDWMKEVSDLFDYMGTPLLDIPKQIKRLDPPMNWFEKFTGREVGYWGGWKRKAKKKIKNLPKEEREEAKEELESLMTIHWELKKDEGQLEKTLGSLTVFWDKEKAILRKEIEESNKKVARLNAEEARLKNDVVEIEKEETRLKEELRRRGRFDLLKKLEEKELKSRQKKQA